MFLMETQTLAIILLLCCIVPVAVLIVLALIFRLKNAAKSKNAPIEENKEFTEEQRKEFLEAYGGEENVEKVSVERSKISVLVKEIDLVKSARLQELGATNVLLIGNEVRSSFGDRAQYIYEIIK